MSDSSADREEFIARLKRMNAETEKFVAEQRKLIAEAQKLDRDRWLAPWLAVVGIAGGLLAIANFLTRGRG